MEKKAEIFEIELDDNETGLAFELPIEPFGFGQFGTDTKGDEGGAMLREIEANWNSLWPKIREAFREEQEDYDLELDLAKDEFIASIQLLQPDEYKSDEAKYFLRFHFDGPPLMDFFIQDGDIPHYQPVF